MRAGAHGAQGMPQFPSAAQESSVEPGRPADPYRQSASCFQDYRLFPRLTTAENVAIPLILKRRNWDDSMREARRVLDVVGLSSRADLTPTKLSGGEQQWVAIARAIVSARDVLIFDEPTASLDGDTAWVRSATTPTH
jgi:ABC-type ATPase involved in cell division